MNKPPKQKLWEIEQFHMEMNGERWDEYDKEEWYSAKEMDAWLEHHKLISKNLKTIFGTEVVEDKSGEELEQKDQEWRQKIEKIMKKIVFRKTDLKKSQTETVNIREEIYEMLQKLLEEERNESRIHSRLVC